MKKIKQLDARSEKRRRIRHFVYMIVFVVVFSTALSLYSHLRYHRSAAATVAEFDLRLLLARQDQSELTKKLEAMLEEGKTTYEIPAYIRLRSDVERTVFEHDGASMQVFHLFPKSAEGSDQPDEVSVGGGTIIYYLHGGSYLDEPTAFHWETLDQFASELSCEVIVPDYPKIPFDAADDSYPLVYAHYRQTVDQHPESRIVLMGDSAGGGYCLGLIAYLEGLAYLPGDAGVDELFSPRSRSMYLPDDLVLLSPWVDVSMGNPVIQDYVADDPMLKKDQLELCGLLWAGSRSVTDPLISPLYAFRSLEGDDERLEAGRRMFGRTFPRTLVFVGTREMFYPDVMELYQVLLGTGCDVTLSVGEGMNHVWVVYPIPEGETAVQEIESFITK